MTLEHLLGVFQARKGVRKGEMVPRAPVAWGIEKCVLGSPGALQTSPPTAAFGRDLPHTINEGALTTEGARTSSQGAEGFRRGAANGHFPAAILELFGARWLEFYCTNA